MASYPRVYVSSKTHARVQRMAKKLKTDMNKIEDKIAY